MTMPRRKWSQVPSNSQAILSKQYVGREFISDWVIGSGSTVHELLEKVDVDPEIMKQWLLGNRSLSKDMARKIAVVYAPDDIEGVGRLIFRLANVFNQHSGRHQSWRKRHKTQATKNRKHPIPVSNK